MNRTKNRSAIRPAPNNPPATATRTESPGVTESETTNAATNVTALKIVSALRRSAKVPAASPSAGYPLDRFHPHSAHVRSLAVTRRHLGHMRIRHTHHTSNPAGFHLGFHAREDCKQHRRDIHQADSGEHSGGGLHPSAGRVENRHE